MHTPARAYGTVRTAAAYMKHEAKYTDKTFVVVIVMFA